MRSRDAVLLALAAAVVGGASGFLGASLLQGERSVRASAAPAPLSTATQPRAPAGATVEPRAAPETVERAAAAAASEAPALRLSESEVERAVAAVAAPSIVDAAGLGTIRGEVRDESGAPLGGAVIVGTPTEPVQALGPERVGGGPPKESNLDDHLRESARRWARTHGSSRRAVSAADGAFELAGLDPRSNYSLSAYLEGHALEAQGSANPVSVGQRVDFRAEPVLRIPVRLVFEGGGSPSDAVLGVKRGTNEQQYAWSSSTPELRLTPGRVGLRAYAGDLRSGVGRDGVDSSHASQELDLEVADQAGAPIELVLTPRSGIRGRIVDEFGATDGRQLVRLLALGSDGAIDPEALAESRRYARPMGDRFHLLDLEPGQYAIGLSDWNNALMAHQAVTVGAGVVEVELAVPEPDPDEHLIVRAFGPSGRPLRDLEFRLQSRSGGGSRSGNVQGRRDPDGSYWLRPKADFFEAWGKETSHTLTVVHAQLGEREVALAEGQREIEVHFTEPVTLVVVVAGYAGSGWVGKLQIALAPLVEGPSESELGQRMHRSRSGGGDPFSPEGVARFEGLAPGRWRVTLRVETGDWQTRQVGTADVLATHGEQTVALSLPALYDLTVRAPRLAEGAYLFLNRVAAEDSKGAFSDGHSSAQLGPDGRAVFRGLAAGDYVLQANGLPDTVEVTVPCAEVLLDSRPPDCLRVAIGDMEGALYKAGLRAGDLILAVDGVDLGADPELYQALMGKGSMELTVLRDSKTLKVALPRIDANSQWWNTLGGMLSPASRP
jgi:hypothetical protein